MNYANLGTNFKMQKVCLSKPCICIYALLCHDWQKGFLHTSS